MGTGWPRPGRRAGSFTDMEFRLVLYVKSAVTRGLGLTAHVSFCIFIPLTGLARFDTIIWRRAMPFGEPTN